MGRPTRNGLGYTYVYCDFFEDPKMEEIAADERFGELGPARALRILLYIYGNEGCFLEWNPMTPRRLAKQAFFNVTVTEEIKDLVLRLIELGFFVLLPGKKTADGQEKDVSYLTHWKIYKDWKETRQKAKLKINWAEIPPEIIDYGEKKIEEEKEREKAAKKRGKSKSSEEIAINTEETPVNTEETPAKTGIKCTEKKRKELQTNKQTKEQTSEVSSSGSTGGQCSAGSRWNPHRPLRPRSREPNIANPGSGEEIPQQPDILTEAKQNPRWPEVRLRLARKLYSPGLSADLIDWFTVAGLNQWIKPTQIDGWKRDARDELELFQRSKGRAGKAKLWEVLRPKLEDALSPHNITLPACDPKRREPPPPPENPEGRDPATAASRRV